MKSFVLIFFILLFDLIAFTIILPLFPSIIDFYGEKNASDVTLKCIYEFLDWIRSVLNVPDRRRYNNVLVAGMLGSLFSFLQFLSSPIIGACSDIFGRRKMLVFCMIGSCLSYAIWWKAETFTLFILSRIIAGFAKGSVTLSTTIVSDISTEEERGKGMAYVGLAFSCGFISGPLIGAYFASLQTSEQVTYVFSLPAQIAIFIQLLSLMLTLFLLEETKHKDDVHSMSRFYSKVLRLTNPIALFTFTGATTSKVASSLQKLVLAYFFFLLFFSGLEFTLPFLTHERFNFSSMQQGKLLVFTGIVMMIIQGGYVRKMKHNQEKKISLQGMMVLIPAMAILSISLSVEMTYVALSIYSFGAATVVPCITSLFTQLSERCDAGENIGVLRSSGALARAVAPFLSCTVYWIFGSSTCYGVGALLFIIPIILLKRMDTKVVPAKAN